MVFLLTAMLTFMQARGRYASLTRDREPDDPELVAARQQMQEIALVNAIDKALAKAPPITEELRARIIALLSGDDHDHPDRMCRHHVAIRDNFNQEESK
jgi:hypothetical protein